MDGCEDEDEINQATSTLDLGYLEEFAVDGRLPSS